MEAAEIEVLLPAESASPMFVNACAHETEIMTMGGRISECVVSQTVDVSVERQDHDVEVVKVIPQERIAERSKKQIVDVPVSGIMEAILQVIQLVRQERIQERIVEVIIDVPVPEVVEKTVGVGKHILQEGMQSYIVEQIVGVPFPQTRKKIREVTELIP